MHPDDAIEDLPTQVMPSIISPATRTAVKNIVKIKIATALWQTKNFLHLAPLGKYLFIFLLISIRNKHE